MTDLVLMKNQNFSSGIISFAHNQGVRVSTKIGDNDIDKYQLNRPTYRRNKVKQLVDFVVDNNFDGINVDCEAPFYTDFFHTGFVKFLEELKLTLASHKRNSIITIDLPYGPYQLLCVTGRCLPWKEISEVVDYVLIMCYDAQLRPLSPEPTDPFIHVVRGWDLYIEDLNINPLKMIQAIPWYGPVYHCRTNNQNDIKSTNDTCQTNVFTQKIQHHLGELSKEVQLGLDQGFEIIYDEEYKSRKIIFRDEDTDEYYLAWFNCLDTLKMRFDSQALKSGAGGVSTWWAFSLDYEDKSSSNVDLNEKLWGQLRDVLDELEAM